MNDLQVNGPSPAEIQEIEGLEHSQRIAAAMAPDPTEWAYHGEVIDSGPGGGARCTCGHPIRYIFLIERERDGKKLPIGSVCIDSTVPFLISSGADGLADRLSEARQKLEEDLKEEKRRAREQAAEVEVQELLGFWEVMKEWRLAAWQAGRAGARPYLVGRIYKGLGKPTACSTAGRTAASLTVKLATAYADALHTLRADGNHRFPLPELPEPPERVAEKLEKSGVDISTPMVHNDEEEREMTQVERLDEVKGRLAPGDRDFAESLINAAYRYGLSGAQEEWVGKLVLRAEKGPDADRHQEKVDNVAAIFELMHRAKEHLKYPKVRIQTEGGKTVAFSVAGDRAKHPGSINVTDGRPYGSNRWYGRILEDGSWVMPRTPIDQEVKEAVRKFAEDPARAATAHGKLTGNCCFCRKELTDGRSLAMGYGPVCAGHYGLPWGEERIDAAAEVEV